SVTPTETPLPSATFTATDDLSLPSLTPTPTETSGLNPASGVGNPEELTPFSTLDLSTDTPTATVDPLVLTPPTATLIPTETPIPSATPIVPTPPQVTPTFTADPQTVAQAGTQVADAALQDLPGSATAISELNATATALNAQAEGQVPPAQQPIVPPVEAPPQQPGLSDLNLTATAINEGATQTAEFQTALANVQPSLTPTPPIIPTTAAPPTAAAAPDQPVLTGDDCVHEVRRGQNLFRIGLLYGLPYQDIARYNSIVNPNFILEGQQLRIEGCGTSGAQPPPTSTPRPNAATSVPPSGGGQTYTVMQNDTLFSLSLRFGPTVHEIAAVNGIANINLIYIGQELIIP
ncbi:MAG: LysM peptidoglycan-binding domain-containing protein, partial [Chloroflexi bacterium]|nr:LysM peptidoglycan-binding domain-containing protein [Chloroflexota bacterium]